ncbi:MAG: hypothetical protein JOY82_09890 [Streptosporangiaceae bacterium]|nr:hypothetical protein [Streptosporangiaceae bacterium]MBV9854821.1 hypothetical protein [Streptosporangiaceae bacterium]
MNAGSDPGVSFHVESHAPVEDTLLSFLTSVHPEKDVEPSCHADIARKRNVGLMLARLCGWHTIMYIAEGLYRLLHEGADVIDATDAYWRSTLERRFQLIDDIAARLLAGNAAPPVTGYALMSLAAARKRLSAISPLSCLSFVRAWRTDLDSWRDRMLGLPEVGGLPDAAKFLGLPAQESCVNQ